MTVLSGRDLAFWNEYGYVAVPGEQLARLVETIWDFLEMDPDRPDDWYTWAPYDRNDPQTPTFEAGTVSMYQPLVMWDSRQYAGVQGLRADIWRQAAAGLAELSLDASELGGTVPSEPGQLAKLKELRLAGNPGLTGCVPTPLGNVAEHDLSEPGLPVC